MGLTYKQKHNRKRRAKKAQAQYGNRYKGYKATKAEQEFLYEDTPARKTPKESYRKPSKKKVKSKPSNDPVAFLNTESNDKTERYISFQVAGNKKLYIKSDQKVSTGGESITLNNDYPTTFPLARA